MYCTRKHIPLKISWAKTIHCLQGHNAGQTAKHQTPNDIQRIEIHLGGRTDERLNPGFTYVVVYNWGPGTHKSIPRKCRNSYLYFRAASATIS
jgi:hypothetical protein